MSRTFRIVLSIMTFLAFTLLFFVSRNETGIIILPVLLIAFAGALRIIWKEEKK